MRTIRQVLLYAGFVFLASFTSVEIFKMDKAVYFGAGLALIVLGILNMIWGDRA